MGAKKAVYATNPSDCVWKKCELKKRCTLPIQMIIFEKMRAKKVEGIPSGMSSLIRRNTNELIKIKISYD